MGVSSANEPKGPAGGSWDGGEQRGAEPSAGPQPIPGGSLWQVGCRPSAEREEVARRDRVQSPPGRWRFPSGGQAGRGGDPGTVSDHPRLLSGPDSRRLPRKEPRFVVQQGKGDGKGSPGSGTQAMEGGSGLALQRGLPAILLTLATATGSQPPIPKRASP